MDVRGRRRSVPRLAGGCLPLARPGHRRAYCRRRSACRDWLRLRVAPGEQTAVVASTRVASGVAFMAAVLHRRTSCTNGQRPWRCPERLRPFCRRRRPRLLAGGDRRPSVAVRPVGRSVHRDCVSLWIEIEYHHGDGHTDDIRDRVRSGRSPTDAAAARARGADRGARRRVLRGRPRGRCPGPAARDRPRDDLPRNRAPRGDRGARADRPSDGRARLRALRPDPSSPRGLPPLQPLGGDR